MGWPEVPPEWDQPSLAADFKVLRELRNHGNKALSLARDNKRIGGPLEAFMHIETTSKDLIDLLMSRFESDKGIGSSGYSLEEFLGVSKVVLNSDTPELPYSVTGDIVMEREEVSQVTISTDKVPLDYSKCPRCWKYVSRCHDNALCERCQMVTSV